MNKLFKYRNNKRLSVIAGVLLAVVIVCTQSMVHDYGYVSSSIGLQKSTDDEHNEPAPQYITQDAVSAPAIQLNLDKPFQVVFELVLSEERNNEAEPGSVPLNFQFLRNLFRIIISPNAP